MIFIPGIFGFILFLIYDINSVTKQNRFIEKFFFAGFSLIVLSTIFGLIRAFRIGAFSGVFDIIPIIMALASLAALIYCLFFALPFEATYISPDQERHVYDGGVYAMCRHPGVICFFMFYLFTGIAAYPSGLLTAGMTYSFLNLLYVCFQDRFSFPRTFCDYEDYKKRVPFIIPNIQSIKKGLLTLNRINRKEDSK